jgi:rare lipoprotein A
VKVRPSIAALIVLVAVASGCAHRGSQGVTEPSPTTGSKTQQPSGTKTDEARKGATEKGLASWYGEPYHGRRTASGEIYDMHELTAAHRTLPFGTMVKVTRRDTGADVRVRITDRGPFIEGRIIDLSFAAAKKIDLDIDGVAPVKVVVVGHEDPPKKKVRQAKRAAEHLEDDSCLWIQVGAFSDRGNAERAERRLEAAGETAVVIEGPGGLHRVRVGPFDREKDAVKALERIRPDWPVAKTVPCG